MVAPSTPLVRDGPAPEVFDDRLRAEFLGRLIDYLVAFARLEPDLAEGLRDQIRVQVHNGRHMSAALRAVRGLQNRERVEDFGMCDACGFAHEPIEALP